MHFEFDERMHITLTLISGCITVFCTNPPPYLPLLSDWGREEHHVLELRPRTKGPETLNSTQELMEDGGLQNL